MRKSDVGTHNTEKPSETDSQDSRKSNSDTASEWENVKKPSEWKLVAQEEPKATIYDNDTWQKGLQRMHSEGETTTDKPSSSQGTHESVEKSIYHDPLSSSTNENLEKSIYHDPS